MKSYVHLLGRLVCLQASPYYLLRSAGVVWVVPAITYVSYNGAVIICQVSQPWDIRSDRDFYVRLPLRSESSGREHYHGKTQHIPGKQVLQRS